MASLLEAFKIPLVEMNARYRKSELALMGWRSRETAWNMRESAARNRAKTTDRPVQDVMSDMAITQLEQRMGTVASKATTEDGDIDLGRLTGPEALKYMSALGIQMGSRR